MGKLILLILKVMAWTYWSLPLWFQRRLGDGVGFILLKLKFRSGVIERNLGLAFADDPALQQGLRRSAYTHLGNLILEIPLLFGPMRRYVRRYVKIKGLENLERAQSQGRGVLFLSSHVGNWEVMAASGSVQYGINILLVTKRLKPEWLHRAVENGRLDCGVHATYEPRTLRAILSHLKQNGTVGFILDQYAGPPIGVRVPVFGIPVGTSNALSTLAKRTGAPVLPVVNYREPDGRWVVEIRPPLQWQTNPDPNYELASNTAMYAAQVERDIYEHPGQWLWIHRRFKGDLSPLRETEWESGRTRSPNLTKDFRPVS